MLMAASAFPEYQLVIGGAPGIRPDYYNSFLKNYPATIIFDQTYSLLQQSKAALVTSGTATLETALLRVPQVVCYKTPIVHILKYVWKFFFKVKYISLVNLIIDRPLVRELFNENFSVENIRKELNDLLNNTSYIESMQSGYDEVIKQLGETGASERAASEIVKVIGNYFSV